MRHSSNSGIQLFEGQQELLQNVSRTFALTIPELPEALRTVVNNAYLLCRIADTIEDESALDNAQKSYFHDYFLCLLTAEKDSSAFASELVQLLNADATESERELVLCTPKVIAQVRSFTPPQQRALLACLQKMCEGMPRFDRNASIAGLPNQEALDEYCYYVAGVVGEMLTHLFADHAELDDDQRQRMLSLSISFGQGLQMVNILKDFWEDHDRGVCWLPRDLFARFGISLGDVERSNVGSMFSRAYSKLVGIAHGHLLHALDYTLLIPRSETGIRRFCLIALVLAIKTLQKIERNPGFTDSKQVKVSRTVVASTLLRTRLWAGNDDILKRWFRRMGKNLPLNTQIYQQI